MTNKKTLLNIIEGAVVICLLIFIALIMGKGKAKDVAKEDIANAFLKLESTEGLLEKKDYNVNQSFGYVPSEYVYIKSDQSMDVREILVVKTSSDEEMEKVENAVSERLNEQIGNFTNYGTNQLSLLENAIASKIGNYYFYAVGEDASEWMDVFKKLVK